MSISQRQEALLGNEEILKKQRKRFQLTVLFDIPHVAVAELGKNKECSLTTINSTNV